MASPFYITTAISYPNGRPHIGHAYEVIATDAIARYQRLAGRDVFFLTGTDEHGLKMVADGTRQSGIEPRVRSPTRCRLILGRWTQVLNISHRSFHPHHRACASTPRRKRSGGRMARAGDIYLGRYEGWYSVRDEAFYDEEELIGWGPAGKRFSPSGHAGGPGRSRSRAGSSAYPPMPTGCCALRGAIPDFIRPESAAQRGDEFVRGGLSDLSISRTSFDWGVPVPDAARRT